MDTDDKRRARLNCIAHLLTRVSYQDVPPPPIAMPDRQADEGYVRPSRDIYHYVPDHGAGLLER